MLYKPKSYEISNELKSFFSIVTSDQTLQTALYQTEKLSDVAVIAQKLGFNVRGAEILQAQAGRVLAMIDEQPEDVSNLLAGKKAKTGAQWGRGGGGFLDNAGYWLIELATPTSITETEEKVNHFLEVANQKATLKKEILAAKTFNELASLMQAHVGSVKAIELLKHQAQKILSLTEDEADHVASN